jgi:penicillin-binding protein 1A
MVALIAAASILGAGFDLPKLPPITREPQVTYVDRNGALLGVRGGRFEPPVNIAKLPAYVPAAFVAIEDKRFYEHPGFDAVGIARAIVADLSQGRAAQGASTITQQLARNLFLNDNRTVERKAQELLYAVQLERTYSKPQILGLYLSRVYFGAGAYGLEAASERYFNKPAARLTIREAAMLAALMKSPTEYNPIEQPQRSAERTALVLDAMVDIKAITPAQRTRALAQSPRVYRDPPNAPAQYFIDYLDGQRRRLAPSPRQDLVVVTTLDLPMEQTAAAAAADGVARLKAHGVQQAAVVALDAQGRIRTLLGGIDYASSPFNRAVDAHRQVGSAWKPFVYLTAMEQGQTPDTMAVDQPVTIGNWSPQDFEPGYLGQITLETALAQSVNTVAAQLADQVGRPNVAATAHRLGIVSPINTDPAMALGTSLMTPIEMAQAYTPFGNGGYRVTAYGIEQIRTTGGQVVWRHGPPVTPSVIGNPALSEMDRMMRAVVASGTGTKAAIPGYDIAGKTGTTSDFRDAWFCGFTGGLTTVVWMGRDDNAPMRGVTGGLGPAGVWHAFMVKAVKRVPIAPIPAGPPAPVPVLPVAPMPSTAAPLPDAGPAPAGAPGAPLPPPPAPSRLPTPGDDVM